MFSFMSRLFFILGEPVKCACCLVTEIFRQDKRTSHSNVRDALEIALISRCV